MPRLGTLCSPQTDGGLAGLESKARTHDGEHAAAVRGEGERGGLDVGHKWRRIFEIESSATGSTPLRSDSDRDWDPTDARPRSPAHNARV